MSAGDQPDTPPPNDDMAANYSRALDELYLLRGLAQHEADVLEAHLGLKSFPKSRRPFAEEQVKRLRLAAEGKAAVAHDQAYDSSLTFRRREGQRTLTRSSFEAELSGRSEDDL